MQIEKSVWIVTILKQSRAMDYKDLLYLLSQNHSNIERFLQAIYSLSNFPFTLLTMIHEL